MNGIADTGFLVALVRLADADHQWASSVLEGLAKPLLTCDSVLAETTFHLGSARIVLEMIDDGLITLAFSCTDNMEQLAWLAKRYEDRIPDFADLCIIRMSELFPRHKVITTDSDFRVYRRNRREVIPLICPP